MTRPITPRHVIRFAISVLVFIFAFMLATDAHASESPTWEERAIVNLTPDMILEWRQAHERLPRWIPAPPAPIQPSYSIARTYSPAVERWRPLVEAHFQPRDVPWAMRVLNCESNGNQWAKNPTSTASGLFQFLRGWWSGAWGGTGAFDPFDPEANVRAAAWLLYNGGASHWVCK